MKKNKKKGERKNLSCPQNLDNNCPTFDDTGSVEFSSELSTCSSCPLKENLKKAKEQKNKSK